MLRRETILPDHFLLESPQWAHDTPHRYLLFEGLAVSENSRMGQYIHLDNGIYYFLPCQGGFWDQVSPNSE